MTHIFISFFFLKGKSLSLLCGSLKWLNDFKEEQRLQLEILISDEKKK